MMNPWNTLSIHGGVKYIDPQVGYLNRYYNVDESNANYSSLDGVLYNKDKTKLISVPIGTRSITIPDTVKEIGRFAFAYCYNLKRNHPCPSRLMRWMPKHFIR